MRRAIALSLCFVSWSLACDKQSPMPPTTCMVDLDCPEHQYCEAPPVTGTTACYVAVAGECRPVDQSTYPNTPCTNDWDCKADGILCHPQAHTCSDYLICITDPGFVVRPEDCRSDCTFGSRTYTCAACFCPSCPAADGAAQDTAS